MARLAATSGRTQRAVAEDIDHGLSVLVRWIGHHRDRLTDMPGEVPQEDMVAEAKRVGRVNEVPRQE